METHPCIRSGWSLLLLMLLLGGGGALGAPGTAAATSSTDASRTGTPPAPRSEVSVPLRAEAGGLWVEARIGSSTPLRMMVDTGASVVVLPESLARSLGLTPSGPDVTLQTLQGTVKGRTVTLKSLSVGSARALDVRAVVVPDGRGVVALLGRSFLSRFRLGIDLDAQQLLLTPRANPADQARSGQTPEGVTYRDAHVEQLQHELLRALRDPASSPSYLRTLQSALAQWERTRR